MNTKIMPMVGFDKIRFGMKLEEVTKILGQPDAISTENYGEGKDEELVTVAEFYDLNINMSFEKAEGDRLTEMSFEDERYTLGKIKVGMNKEEAMVEASAMGLGEYYEEELDEEENQEGYEMFDFEDQNVTLWFLDDVVDAIQIGPDFLGDEIRWPKK